MYNLATGDEMVFSLPPEYTDDGDEYTNEGDEYTNDVGDVGNNDNVGNFNGDDGNFNDNIGYLSDEQTDDEELARDYNEMQNLFDDIQPFNNSNDTSLSVQQKFDKDIVTPYLFGKLVGGGLSLNQVKMLGDLTQRRKLYRNITSIFN